MQYHSATDDARDEAAEVEEATHHKDNNLKETVKQANTKQQSGVTISFATEKPKVQSKNNANNINSIQSTKLTHISTEAKK